MQPRICKLHVFVMDYILINSRPDMCYIHHVVIDERGPYSYSVPISKDNRLCMKP